MDAKLKSFYCYLNNGNPVILKKEPENFSNLPYYYATFCPNLEIASMTYQTNLKIREWRAVDK